jgi:hypothetical protein
VLSQDRSCTLPHVNEAELREFMAARKPSPHAARLDVSALTCYGCAHSAASEPPPSRPSGERPCCSCVRNPEREEWTRRAREDGRPDGPEFVPGADGHARTFDPFVGTSYNGAPRVYFPSDNYVTMDSGDQERFLERHPEYAKPVRFVDGVVHVVEDE